MNKLYMFVLDAITLVAIIYLRIADKFKKKQNYSDWIS